MATDTTQLESATRVDVSNFIRAESDRYFAKFLALAPLGSIAHLREPTSIDHQDVVRMNRDTIYSSAVFDLGASPVTITLPEAGKRFMSLLVISQDHYAIDVVYAPGRFTYTKEQVGTRYMVAAIRTLADPTDAADLAAAQSLQDGARAEQDAIGRFEVPEWDSASRDAVRTALEALGAYSGFGRTFGRKDEVDPVAHLIGTATAWGGNPNRAATYVGGHPAANDGKTPHTVTVRDVPVDGFWSMSVYDAKGFFAKNDLGVYSVNNLTAKANADGSVTIRFGGSPNDGPNVIPITPGWNYLWRFYRPRREILDGIWKAPEPKPV